MSIKAELSSSDREGKRYKVVLNDYEGKKRTIHFGSKGASTFLEHKDDKTKNAWIARHKVRENWNDKYSAGFWARWLLWNKTTLADSKKDIKDRFNISI
jgi:hypothetical protein